MGERELFEEALRALAELLGGPPAAGGEIDREIELSGPDRAVLLAEWLGELAYLAESEALVPLGAPRLELADASLSATVRTRRGDPPHLVKAVTYHRLEFDRAGAGWRARVVLDV